MSITLKRKRAEDIVAENCAPKKPFSRALSVKENSFRNAGIRMDDYDLSPSVQNVLRNIFEYCFRVYSVAIASLLGNDLKATIAAFKEFEESIAEHGDPQVPSVTPQNKSISEWLSNLHRWEANFICSRDAIASHLGDFMWPIETKACEFAIHFLTSKARMPRIGVEDPDIFRHMINNIRGFTLCKLLDSIPFVVPETNSTSSRDHFQLILRMLDPSHIREYDRAYTEIIFSDDGTDAAFFRLLKDEVYIQPSNASGYALLEGYHDRYFLSGLPEEVDVLALLRFEFTGYFRASAICFRNPTYDTVVEYFKMKY
jgi:hypothetical protein